jgi:hypothetical protein
MPLEIRVARNGPAPAAGGRITVSAEISVIAE